MRISTTYQNIQRTLGEKTTQEIVSAYQESTGKVFSEDRHVCVWLLHEMKQKQKSKNWISLLKTKPEEFLRLGLKNDWLKIAVSFKAIGGKVWESDSLGSSVLPEEITLAIQRKYLMQNEKNKWGGEVIDVYTPLHQNHPGLTEHAVVGGVEMNHKQVILLCDQLDPYKSNVWTTYVIEKEGVLLNMMHVCDGTIQKQFLKTKKGEVLNARGLSGVRVSDEVLSQWLGETKKWISCFSEQENIKVPLNVKRFKLGEVAGKQEKRSVDITSVLKQLGQL